MSEAIIVELVNVTPVVIVLIYYSLRFEKAIQKNTESVDNNTRTVELFLEEFTQKKKKAKESP